MDKNTTSNEAMTASFHANFNSLFTKKSIVERCIICSVENAAEYTNK
jgi:hypothetical protein